MSIRNIKTLAPVLLASIAALGSACGASEETTEDSTVRHIYFDAAEVNDALAQDPDTTFLVDLREGNVVYFDQQDEDFDLSAFEAICPSMPAPVPFTQMLEDLDIEVAGQSEWTMQSTLTEQTDFRMMGGCTETEMMCNWFGLDCIFFEVPCT